MSSEQKYMRHELKEVIAFPVFGIFMVTIMYFVIGFIFKGFASSFVAGKPIQFGELLTSYGIYSTMLPASLGLVLFLIAKIFYLKRTEHIATKKNSNWFSILSFPLIHDPEQSGALYLLFEKAGIKIKGANPMNWSINFFRVFIIGTLIFAPLMLWAASTGNAVVGIPHQSFFTDTFTNIYSQIEPPAFAETCLVLFIFCLELGFLGFLISKTKFSDNTKLILFYLIAIFVIALVTALGWMAFHFIVYSSSEAKLVSTFVFGYTSLVLTVLLGSFIFFYLFHFWNNAMLALVQHFQGNEDLLPITIFFIVVLFITYLIGEWLAYKWRKKHRKKLMDFEYD